MKRILKISAALCAVAAVSLSCLKEGQPLASGLTLSQTEIEVDGTSVADVTVKVTADGDWFAVAPDWIEVTPSTGSGDTEVKLKFADNVDSYNELSGPRSGNVSFCYGTSGISPLLVKQKGENGLDASRQYSKVTKAEKIVAGSYLIVFVDGDNTLALKPFYTTSETYYSFLYADEVTEKDGVIETQNSTNSFVFEEATGGYKIKMSNGRYLFQTTYDSFYSTDDAAKAAIWTVAMNEDGTVNITNATVAGRYFQYENAKYNSAGAYNSAKEGYLLPYLYKDSKPASSEVLVVPSAVTAMADDTKATISVTSNATWKVRCHDEWIKTFTPKSGTGNGTIEITFDANTSTTESRTASILVIGETVNYTVAVTQSKVGTTVADLLEQVNSGSSTYSVTFSEDAAPVVSYVNGSNAFIEDKTGAVLLYLENHGLTAGMKISGKVTGKCTVYKNLPELTSLDGATKTEGGTIPCTEVTVADLLANYTKYISRSIILKNVTVTDAIATKDRDGKIKQGESEEVAVRAQSATLNLAANQTGDFITFPSIYNAKKQLCLFEESQFTAKQ